MSSPMGAAGRGSQRGLAVVALAVLLAAVTAADFAAAQTRVVRDGTLGPSPGVQPGVVDTPTGVEVQIDESLGVRRGQSLFHSFQFFDVGAGDGVHFSADTGTATDRVISRVTGGETSNLFGRIRSSIPGADLYLLNPAGVVMGEGASLDVDGSFYASTADSVALGQDDGVFSARTDVPSLLRSAPPSAFGFLDGHAGRVVVDGAALEVPAGEALWLAGGEAIVGESGAATSLAAPGGAVVVVGAGSQGAGIGFDPGSPGATPDVEGRLEGGRVYVGDGSTLVASGPTPGAVHVLAGDADLRGGLEADSLGSGSGGTVRARVTGTLAVTGRLSADARGEGDAGQVLIRGRPDTTLEPGALLSARSLPGVGVGPDEAGAAGLVDLEVHDLEAAPGARLDASSAPDSGGDAGRIEIESRGRLRFTGSGVGGLDLEAAGGAAAESGIVAVSLGEGGAGSVQIGGPDGRQDRAPTLVLRDGAVISTASVGGEGGGRIDVASRRLAIRSGALVDASTLRGERGGDVSLQAASKLIVEGVGADGLPSQVRSLTAGGGDAGSLRLTAPRIGLTDGARLSTVALPAVGDGNAGSIDVRSDRLELRRGAVIDSSTFGQGQAGRVRLIGLDGDAARRVVLDGRNTRVSGQTGGPGDGSELLVQADRIRVLDGAILSTRSAPGLGGMGVALADLSGLDLDGQPLAEVLALLDDANREVEGTGGTLRLRAGRSVVVRGGRIESVAAGAGPAGRIEIRSPRLRVDRGSAITASTSSAGPGGRIRVDGVERLRLADGSVIEATSRGSRGDPEPGDAGSILIDGAPGALLRIVDSRVETSSQGSGGGLIAISSPDGTIDLDNAVVQTDVLEGDRKAGNILFRGQSMVATASEIVARAAQGEGGSIEILVGDFQPSADTVVASTSQGGYDGRVSVRSPETLLSNTPALPVEPEFLDPLVLLRRDCQARARAADEGSFTVVAASADVSRADFPVAWAPQFPEAARDDATTGSSATDVDRPLEAARRVALEARAAARAGDRAQAAAGLARLDAALEGLADRPERVDLEIHGAGTWAELAAGRDGQTASADLLRAHDALRAAARRAVRQGDEERRALALGHLAELYRREARLDEALYLVRRAEATSARAREGSALYRWSWLEGRIQWERGQASEAIAAYARAVAALERATPPLGGFRRDVEPLYLDWVSALLETADRVEDPAARAALLRRARDSMERRKVAELRDYFRDECIADLEAKTMPLDAVSPKAAVVYPVVLPDRLELLVSVRGELERYRVAVGSDRVNRTARRFRREVENRLSLDHVEPGVQLYDWLVRPYAASLAARGVETLVFVPDGALGAIPWAALHGDGTDLNEQFALAVTPGLALVDPRPLSREKLRLLLAGLSEPAEDFAGLDAVPEELAAIRALYGGEVLLDADFEVARLSRAVANRHPSVLHIASHAEFTGDPETSFLLAHDGPISMESLAAIVGQNRFGDDPVELLILSACETAAGDERAALGLAGMAVRAGARSAVGSLWAIDDAAARTFVVEFYRQLRDPQVSRAEALRRAQVALRSDERYAHPYYWSAFLMISDWQ